MVQIVSVPESKTVHEKPNTKEQVSPSASEQLSQTFSDIANTNAETSTQSKQVSGETIIENAYKKME